MVNTNDFPTRTLQHKEIWVSRTRYRIGVRGLGGDGGATDNQMRQYSCQISATTPDIKHLTAWLQELPQGLCSLCSKINVVNHGPFTTITKDASRSMRIDQQLRGYGELCIPRAFHQQKVLSLKANKILTSKLTRYRSIIPNPLRRILVRHHFRELSPVDITHCIPYPRRHQQPILPEIRNQLLVGLPGTGPAHV